MTDHTAAHYARTRLDEYITRPDALGSFPYRQNDVYDFAQEIFRNLLCDATPEEILADLDSLHKEYDATFGHPARLESCLNDLLRNWELAAPDTYSVHWLSMHCLSFSVCPVHRQDYAACFDDELDECATIRQYFPSHDT